MCGRFILDDETIREIINLVDRIDQNITQNLEEKKFNRDFYPTSKAPVISYNDGRALSEMIWGYPHFKGSGVIFNARSETVIEKRMFRNGILENRAVIPVKSFYEWDRDKRKNIISRVDDETMYLAGFYDKFEDEDRFVILTTSSNKSMEKIHPRMPVILEKNEIWDYIKDPSLTREILNKTPKDIKYIDIEPQQTMF